MIKYGQRHKTGIVLDRDVYVDQFADPGDIDITYIITFHGELIFESEDPKQLVIDIQESIKRLNSIASHLKQIGRTK